MNKTILFQDLGLIDYKDAWEIQKNLFKSNLIVKSNNRKNNEYKPTKNHLLFCEHPHVYTLGKGGDLKNLLLDEKKLGDFGVNFYHIDRGGDITYHGPGQIVGYPILDLENFFTDIGRYLRYIEKSIILTLNDFGILGGVSDGETGVWINPGTPNSRKICAIGVKTSRWVTMHGFALNVNTDLSYFNNIIPCGIANKSVSSMEKELGVLVNISDVKKRLTHHLSSVFSNYID